MVTRLAEINELYPAHDCDCCDEQLNARVERHCRRCFALQLDQLEQLRLRDAIVHEGLFSHRTKTSALELRFQTVWKDKQKDNLLAWLLGDGKDVGSISKRDALVAATVIQWLGSDVGQNFLTECSSNKRKVKLP